MKLHFRRKYHKRSGKNAGKMKFATIKYAFAAVLFPVILGVCFVCANNGSIEAESGTVSGGSAQDFTINVPFASSEGKSDGEEAAAGMRDTKSELWYSYGNGENDDPVDFLEEELPASTPDPDRESGKVIETDVSGEKNVGNIAVNDTSDSGLDLEEEIKKELNFTVDKSDDQPTVLIYHTHTCESYMSYFSGFYYKDMSFRSTDCNKNVAAVGERLKKALEDDGYTVIHDMTIYDAPAFNGAYQRSMASVQDYLKKYPSIKVTIDLHRDSMANDDGDSYKPTAKIDGRKAAQMMIIAGSDPTGELEYKNWQDNLLFALKIEEKGAELYPGLMRPIMFCQRMYNMDATNASFLVEIGTETNTLGEAEYSGTLLGNILSQVLDTVDISS